MSMHQGIDLSRFKKVSSDKKTTTLRHAKGHEIKIAHSALTPKMKEQIASLEKHEESKGRKMYADSDEPVSADDDAPEADDAAAASPELDQSSPAPEPADGAQAPAPEPEEAPPQSYAPHKQYPVAQPVQPQMGPPATSLQPADISAELKQHDSAIKNDLDQGFIKPETYQDLFNKKDTLGKIGTLFGLMLSGAGSGITGQPNAVMEMMNNEIKNDMAAKTTGATNRQNLYRINLEHQMNAANIGQKVKEGLLTDAQAKVATTEAASKAYALTNMQKNRMVFHHLVMSVNKMPVGSPQRVAAEQQLAIMSKAVDSENYDIADRAAAAAALGKAAFGDNGGGSNPEGSFQGQQNTLRMTGNEPLANDRATRHMPGVEGMASVPLSGEDRTKITSGITFQRQMEDFINWTKNHSGDLSPSDRKTGIAKAAALQGAYRQASNGGVYKEGEQHFIGKIINDVPTVFFNKIRVLPSLAAVKQDSALQLDQHLKSLGFKGYKGFQESKDTKTAGNDMGRKVKDKKTGEIGYYKNGNFTPAAKASK